MQAPNKTVAPLAQITTTKNTMVVNAISAKKVKKAKKAKGTTANIPAPVTMAVKTTTDTTGTTTAAATAEMTATTMTAAIQIAGDKTTQTGVTKKIAAAKVKAAGEIAGQVSTPRKPKSKPGRCPRQIRLLRHQGCKKGRHLPLLAREVNVVRPAGVF